MRRFITLSAVLAMWVAPALAHDYQLPHPTLPECIEGDPRLMLPDMVPEQPSDVRNSRKLSRRKIEFTTKVGNIGVGALILEGKTVSDANGVFTHAWQIINMRDGGQCARSAGRFVYHPQHTHYHFDRWVSYELRRDDPIDGELVGTGYKASFCLLDTENIRGYPSSIYLQTPGFSCGTSEGRQGISVGWQDVYERHLPDQNIDLDGPNPVEPGGYFLVFDVDPEQRLWELDRSNNLAFVFAGVTLGVPGRDDAARQPPLLPDNAIPVKPSRAPTAAPSEPPSTTRPTAVPPTPVPPTPTTGSQRPTKEPKPTKPPKPTKEPKPTKPPKNLERPDRPVRPARPERPTRLPRPGEVPTPVRPTTAPTAAPTTPPTARPTTAPTQQPTVPPSTGGSCNPTCFYDLKQVRMTWLSHLGLSLTGTIDMRGCPTIPIDGQRAGFLNTYNWMTEDFASDTGIQHNTTFVLNNGAGDTSSGGRWTMSPVNNGARFSYTLNAVPPSNAEDGQEFPVVFDFCMGIGEHRIAGRLVCQPKATGMLCHE